MKTTLIYNALIPGAPQGVSRVLFNKHEILALGGEELSDADEKIDARGMLLLPGAIDAHVHFREPGLTHKADISTESAAALAGGVTSFFDMPNTVPQTTDEQQWKHKMEIASKDSKINYAFFIGATNSNIDEISRLDFSLIPGVKVFLGSSTGGMLVNDRSILSSLFKISKAPIVVHAENEDIINRNRLEALKTFGGNPPVSEHSRIRSSEACYTATLNCIQLLKENPEAHLHIAHLSTKEEVEIIRSAKSEGLNVTCEVSPHHLLFTAEDYEELGARIKMNPAVKSQEDREALRNGLLDGTIDIIATDHAPHLLEEKEGNALTAVSGAPMIQFSLPLMLDMFGPILTLRKMATEPARIFGLEKRGVIAPGFKPEMVMVEYIPDGYTVSDADVLSKCGWTPIAGRRLYHRVRRTFISHPEALKFIHR